MYANKVVHIKSVPIEHKYIQNIITAVSSTACWFSCEMIKISMLVGQIVCNIATNTRLGSAGRIAAKCNNINVPAQIPGIRTSRVKITEITVNQLTPSLWGRRERRFANTNPTINNNDTTTAWDAGFKISITKNRGPPVDPISSFP